MPHANPPTTKSTATIELLEHDALLPHLSDETPLGRLIKAEIQSEGYVVIRNVLTPEECDGKKFKCADEKRSCRSDFIFVY
eukprot:scaffold3722_cov103-Cyclotella_meneghiniana.AAC.5